MAEPVIAPHFRVPFAITDGAAEVVEQDTDEEILQCVEAICRTERGSRIDAPNFGIPEIVFREGGINEDVLHRAITDHEPRANAYISTMMGDDALMEIIKITVGGSR